MNWLLFTLLAIFSRSTYSIATKMLSKDVKVSAITHSLLLTTFAGLLSLFISPFVGGISFVGVNNLIIPTIIMIISQAIGNILFFKGIKKLDAGTSQIAFSSILIWSTLLAIFFLDSVFSIIQIIGIILMLVAILIVQYQKGKLDLSPGILYIVASAAMFAVFQVFSAKLSGTISTGAYLLLAYLGPSVLIGLIYYGKIKKDFKLLQSQLKSSFFKTLFASGTSLLYFVFSYIAYQQAPDSGIVIILLTAQVVLSVLFGIVFLKERQNIFKKIAAGILAFIAGALIKS